MKIKIHSRMLYRRYIVIGNEETEILALDTNFEDGGTALYLWQFNNSVFMRGYDLDHERKPKIIGVDCV